MNEGWADAVDDDKLVRRTDSLHFLAVSVEDDRPQVMTQTVANFHHFYMCVQMISRGPTLALPCKLSRNVTTARKC